MKSPALQQFFLLMLLLFTGIVFHSGGQIAEYPYEQGFETAFLTGKEVEFLPNWQAQEVSSGGVRVHQAGAAESRSGGAALGVVPTGSFSADIRLLFDAGSPDVGEISFWARSAQNGSGSRPAIITYSFSADGGETFTDAFIAGNEAGFPNTHTEYQEYFITIPDKIKGSAAAVLRLQVKRGAGGEGTAAKVLIDDFRISGGVSDFRLLSAIALSQNQTEILFNKSLHRATAESAENYRLNQGAEIFRAILDKTNDRRVVLTTSPLMEGIAFTLRTGAVLDGGGNSAEGQEAQFVPQFSDKGEVRPFSLLISEIHAAPKENTLLPNVEWVEIYNASDRSIQLEGMGFADESRAATLPAYVLQPGAYLILAPQSAVAELESYGATAGLSSWPALNNDADILSLYNKENMLSDRVAYSQSWYGSSLKSQGGWSLERIDLRNPCVGASNWTASADNSGGTPGRANSVAGDKPDNTGPELLMAFMQDSLTIQLVFNEAIDTTQLQALNLELKPPIQLTLAEPVPDRPERLMLRLLSTADTGQTYKLSFSNLTDCSGNLMKPVNEAEVVYLRLAKSGEVVLNEVMFDPMPESEEWIEIANITGHYLDLQNWQLATWDSGVKSSVVLSRESLILKPHGFLVFSSNSAGVMTAFPAAPEENMRQLPAMPALPNTGDTLSLLSPGGILSDKFGYHKGLHSPFAKETKGISLEKINSAAPGNSESNWTSASESVNFGSPGMPNSQRFFEENGAIGGSLDVEPEVIIPGSASTAAFATIRFKAPEAGLQLTLRIFDTDGREIRTLAHNQLAGTDNFYTWDGTTEAEGRVRMGYYIVFLHLYGQNGYSRTFRKTIVVGK